jgi:hypothetical protein
MENIKIFALPLHRSVTSPHLYVGNTIIFLLFFLEKIKNLGILVAQREVN